MAGPCASPFCPNISHPTTTNKTAAPFFSFDDLSAGEAFFISLTFTMFLCAFFFAAYVIVYGVEIRHHHTHDLRLGDLEAGLLYTRPWLYGPPPAYDEEGWGDLTLPVYVGRQGSPPDYEMFEYGEVMVAEETDVRLG